jgi:hypothetical protein
MHRNSPTQPLPKLFDSFECTNHDISPDTWKKIAVHDQLKHLARYYKISPGKNKHETAVNLSNGYGLKDTNIVTFNVNLHLP